MPGSFSTGFSTGFTVLNLVVNTIVANKGSIAGGNIITINGDCFQDFQLSGIVKIGGIEVLSYSLWSMTQLKVVVPPGTLGFADVAVTIEGDETVTVSNGYKYINTNIGHAVYTGVGDGVYVGVF